MCAQATLAEGYTMNDWQGVEIDVEVPCSDGRTHTVRLRIKDWGDYRVVYNPCIHQSNPASNEIPKCQIYLQEEFPSLFHRDKSLKLRLMEALVSAGEPAIPAIKKASEDLDLRAEACAALGRIGTRRAAFELVQLLGDWQSKVRNAANDALAVIGEPAVPILVSELMREHQETRATEVCKVLVRIGAPAIPILVQALNSKHAHVRRAVCEVLGQIGNPQATAYLVQALNDQDFEVCRVACEALGNIGSPETVSLFIRILGSAVESIHQAAYEALTKIGIPAVPSLINTLGMSDARVRAAVCKALGRIGDIRAIPALSVLAYAGEKAAINALQEMGQCPIFLKDAIEQVAVQENWGVLIRALPDENVRQAVVELGVPAIPHLIEALGDGDVNVRVAACKALGQLKASEAVQHLVRLVGSTEDCLHTAACWALGEIGDLYALPALSVWKHIRDQAATSALIALRHPTLRLTDAVAQIASQGEWSGLIRALPKKPVREAIVKLGQQAIPLLAQALRDKDAKVRKSACEVLKDIDATEVVLMLIPALDDEDEDVRAKASYALFISLSKNPQPIPHLIKALDNSDSTVRFWACLAFCFKPIPETIPSLIRRTEDPEELVRDAACWALSSAAHRILSHLLRTLEESCVSSKKICEILGNSHNPEAIPYLEKLANTDPDCAAESRTAIESIMESIKREQPQP
jgi:HEAT repeat protein